MIYMYMHLQMVGNLDRVEPCQAPFEYKLWTAPDCAGTSYENGNRTWFYFNVKTPRDNQNKIMRFVQRSKYRYWLTDKPECVSVNVKYMYVDLHGVNSGISACKIGKYDKHTMWNAVLFKLISNIALLVCVMALHFYLL